MSRPMEVSRRALLVGALTTAFAGPTTADMADAQRLGQPTYEISSDKQGQLDLLAQGLVDQGKIIGGKFQDISVDGKSYGVEINPTTVARVIMYVSFLYGGDVQVEKVRARLDTYGLQVKEEDLPRVQGEFAPHSYTNGPMQIYVQQGKTAEYFQSIKNDTQSFEDQIAQHEIVHLNQDVDSTQGIQKDRAIQVLLTDLAISVDIGIIIGLIIGILATRRRYSRREVLEQSLNYGGGALAATFFPFQLLDVFGVGPGAVFSPIELQALTQTGDNPLPTLPGVKIISENPTFAGTNGKLFTFSEK